MSTRTISVSLIVAHHLSGDGDTMEMMRAVLDSKLWLATHVVTISIGYSGTFLAGAIAIGYTLRRHLTSRQDASTSKALVSMTYGVICFALFFGVGLHSYGFMEGAFWALSGFIASQLALVALCLLPPRFWRRQPGQELSPRSPGGAALAAKGTA